ncbi:MAG: 16S rRNA (cytidine(1402)-2'-O)-methyltransferase [Clostridia bacterium]
MNKLYIVGTPIGNLEDMSFRAVRVLQEVDLILAEDTRNSIKLLNHFEIKNKMLSYHEHNEQAKSIEFIKLLQEGKNIALISDAGMPGISDPGEILIHKAILAGIEVEVIPGANAAITALIQSGLSTKRFVFEGFLPRKKKDRTVYLKRLLLEIGTSIYYESPHRIVETLKELNILIGKREISLSRELTKKFEETIRGTASELLKYYQDHEPRGEYVLLVAGNISEEVQMSIDDVLIMVENRVSAGENKKEVLKDLAQQFNFSKRDIYQAYLAKRG